ncbi:unnamed protein product [Phytophthora lilii]|uniref:Unnamed protein product n=1 Tax=Phytophthora lilii TaxID=2077276 RepID=A0A9W6YI27_9STRA|nr:unnamed protein product [Phytophthora lilii]
MTQSKIRIPVVSIIPGIGDAVRQQLATSTTSSLAAKLYQASEREIVDLPVPYLLMETYEDGSDCEVLENTVVFVSDGKCHTSIQATTSFTVTLENDESATMTLYADANCKDSNPTVSVFPKANLNWTSCVDGDLRLQFTNIATGTTIAPPSPTATLAVETLSSNPTPTPSTKTLQPTFPTPTPLTATTKTPSSTTSKTPTPTTATSPAETATSSASQVKHPLVTLYTWLLELIMHS